MTDAIGVASAPPLPRSWLTSRARQRSHTLAAGPRLLEGTELIGQAQGSGLREPPYLVRRCDGQIVQLSRLLYEIASQMDGRGPAAIAECAGARLDLRIRPDQIVHVAEHKLAPLGLVAYRDGRAAKLERRNALLALRFRAGILPERTVNRLARLLSPILWPPIVIAALIGLVACDVWLGTSHGVGTGIRAVLQNPAMGLLLFALLVVSLAFHECGHAAACRYGGARPGRIGIGIYLVWPVFYTDVTDSWRLSKRGRLRTDLGGVYFNVVFALAAAAAFLVTRYKLLLIVIVTQQMLVLDQFIPWVRLDGYHIVSDLIGVSDLFARIKPVVVSILPGRRPDPRVRELKPWARIAVATWVLSTLAALVALAIAIVLEAPTYLERGWQSLLIQVHQLAAGLRTGNLMETLGSAIGTLMLLLPLVGITLSCLLLGRRLSARRRASRSRTRPDSSGRPLVLARDRARQSETNYSTLSRRGFGEYRRPAFATSRPSTRTTSAVKSLSPRISEEPTP